ncbi:hypothetical protein WCX72_08975 [Sulfurimonas sp. HSL1-6]|uniref:hypothetical protein n=1 Tax=Thiomicrolovo immobilis TaxID=3131935 RepID=UPI0031F913E1
MARSEKKDTIDFSISKSWVVNTLLFIVEAFFVIGAVVFVLHFIETFPHYDPNSPTVTGDSIAVANSFMVFVTFIFVVVTVAVTVAGFYFTRWWGREKKQVLNENWSELIETIKKDDKLMDKLRTELFTESLEDMMQTHLEEYKKGIDKDVDGKLRKLRVFIEETLKKIAQGEAIDETNVNDVLSSILGEAQ